MKRTALQAIAILSASGLVGCIVITAKIVNSISTERNNINSLQLGVALLGLAATSWGAFLFGRYTIECLTRAKDHHPKPSLSKANSPAPAPSGPNPNGRTGTEAPNNRDG